MSTTYLTIPDNDKVTAARILLRLAKYHKDNTVGVSFPNDKVDMDIVTA